MQVEYNIVNLNDLVFEDLRNRGLEIYSPHNESIELEMANTNYVSTKPSAEFRPSDYFPASITYKFKLNENSNFEKIESSEKYIELVAKEGHFIGREFHSVILYFNK